MPPNTIDFDTVFVDMDSKIADNYGVLTFICVVFGLYFLIAIYARRKDRQDVLKVKYILNFNSSIPLLSYKI